MTVGVVTPYRAQKRLILSLLQKHQPLKKATSFIKVNTVDGFQGREEDVVIVSTVRSNPHGGIGFLADSRRMNVAMTRARHSCVVVGNAQCLAAKDRHWRSFVTAMATKGRLVCTALSGKHRVSAAFPLPRAGDGAGASAGAGAGAGAGAAEDSDGMSDQDSAEWPPQLALCPTLLKVLCKYDPGSWAAVKKAKRKEGDADSDVDVN